MRGAIAGGLAAAVAALGGALPAQAAPPRVAAGFFGMNVPVEATAGAALARLDLGTVRVQVYWDDVQRDPTRPMDWRRIDAVVADLAAHGLRAQPLVAYSATWAQPPEQRILRDHTFAPATTAGYAAFARAVVERYGRDGSFWRAQPALPALPVTAVELWNEENSVAYFKPRPDPGRYGELYRAARAAMRSADPKVVAIVGGLAVVPTDWGHVAPEEFLAGMGTAQVDAVGLHVYGATRDALLAPVVRLRAWMDSHGLASRPIELTEWGWADRDQHLRARLVGDVAAMLPRTDCGIGQALLFSWRGDGYDVADGHGSPLAPALALGAVATAARTGDRDVPRAAVHLCGRAAPDADGDGVADQDDYAPLNPDVVAARRASRPRVHDLPELLGEPVAGTTLRATLGTWDGSPLPARRVVRWEACGAAGCEAVGTGAELALGRELAGRTVRAVVAARNRRGRATAVSGATEPVRAVPLATAPPVVTGDPRLGQVLEATAGSWSGFPTPSVEIRWLACGAGDCLPVGSGGSHRVGPLDLGRRLLVEVTATSAAGSATVRSAPTAAVGLL